MSEEEFLRLYFKPSFMEDPWIEQSNKHNYSLMTPQSAIITRLINQVYNLYNYFKGIPVDVPTDSICFTISIPSTTLPNTTCFPSSQGVFTYTINHY